MTCLLCFVYLKFRSVTPLNTPQHNQDAAQHWEHDQRVMLTPQHRRTPAPPAFQPVPVTFNGHVYQNLPPALATQLAALPPVPVPCG